MIAEASAPAQTATQTRVQGLVNVSKRLPWAASLVKLGCDKLANR